MKISRQTGVRIHAPRAAPERAIQNAIVDYLGRVLRPGYRTVHIPMNPRSKIAGGIEKRMGAAAGIPDLMILCPVGAVAWIEVKAPGGVVSADQVAFAEWLTSWGHPYCVARSIDDVRLFLAAFGIPSREAA